MSHSEREIRYLHDYIRQHWDILHNADFKDPAFAFLVMLEKGRQGIVPTKPGKDIV